MTNDGILGRLGCLTPSVFSLLAKIHLPQFQLGKETGKLAAVLYPPARSNKPFAGIAVQIWPNSLRYACMIIVKPFAFFGG